jgi:hypothetical protein
MDSYQRVGLQARCNSAHRAGHKTCVCKLPLRHRLPHRCFGIGCHKRWGMRRKP